METNMTNAQQRTDAKTGAVIYSYRFNGIEEANSWLAAQTHVIVRGIEIETSRIALDVRCVKLEYTLSEKPLNIKYQINEEKKLRFFLGTKQEKYNRKWQQKNPLCAFVASVKRHWAFSLIGGSVGFFRLVREKFFVLYAFKCN